MLTPEMGDEKSENLLQKKKTRNKSGDVAEILRQFPISTSKARLASWRPHLPPRTRLFQYIHDAAQQAVQFRCTFVEQVWSLANGHRRGFQCSRVELNLC